jgi:hypothetical protein
LRGPFVFFEDYLNNSRKVVFRLNPHIILTVIRILHRNNYISDKKIYSKNTFIVDNSVQLSLVEIWAQLHKYRKIKRNS